MAIGTYLLKSKVQGNDYIFKSVAFVNDTWIANRRTSGDRYETSNVEEIFNIINNDIISRGGNEDWFIAPVYYSASQNIPDAVINSARLIMPNITLSPLTSNYAMVSESGVKLSDGCANISTSYEMRNGYIPEGVSVAMYQLGHVYSPFYTRAYYYAPNKTLSVNFSVLSENIIENGVYNFNNKIITIISTGFTLRIIDNGNFEFVSLGNTNVITINTSLSNGKVGGSNVLSGLSPSPASKKTIEDCTVVLDGAQFFTGNAVTPQVLVYYEQTQLTEDVDFTVGYTNNVYVGQGNVNIAGIGDYEGTRQEHFNIVRANISQATITVPGNPFSYTGNPIEPNVQVLLGSYTAQRSVDYVLRYTNNVNIGTASIEIDCAPAVQLGTGNFTGSTIVTFQITGHSINGCTVVLDGAQFFTGNPITPNVLVYDNVTALQQDVDFTVGYTNNIYVGQANVNIAGIGGYTGTRQEHFNIVRASISQATVTVPGSPFTYTGNPIEPDIQVILGGYTAQRAVDYVLRYSDNVDIGTASIQIDCSPAVELGTGNFTGSRTVTFQIVGNDAPYNPGGTTTPEIGPTEGTWALENDTLSDAPSVHNDLALGLFRAYAVTKAQLSNFGKTLWRPSVLQALKLILSNPLDTIISLGSFPFIVNSSSTAEQIDFNWIDEWIPDGWQYAPAGYPLTTEYQTFTFGQIKLDRYSGTFYDYQPFSEAQIYIPYIGFINVKVNEILNKTIELKYNVNLITGDFTAILELANHVAPQIIGEYQGNMLRELPLAMSTFVDFVGTSIKTAAIVGAAMVAAHSTAQIATSAAGTSRNLFEESLVQADMGNYDYATKLRNQSMQIDSANKKLVQRDAKRAGMAIGASAIGLVTSANQPIPRNGSIGAVSGRTSTQEAFLAVALPHQNIPSNQGMLGYPTNLPGPLENYKGYTEVRDIHIKSATATYSELIEIEKIVRGGIVI